MNALNALLALRAATERRAVPKTTRRHVHVNPFPLVIVGYHLAGDAGAPVALMWGSSATAEPRCLVVPEPRNRGLRFEALAAFADDFSVYLSSFEERNQSELCRDAPQIVVPNSATAAWLGGIVGRFTRNLSTDGDGAVAPSVPLAGKHLSFFGDLLPGSSLVLAVAEVLSTHWQTGQLPSEDLNLGALLGWIEPPAGLDGPQAAVAGEATPPAGPNSDPNWDATTLAGLIQEWHRARDGASQASVRGDFERSVRSQLTPTWNSCWRALDRLASMPVAEHVTKRWDDDRRSWTAHCDRVAADRAFFRNIPTPVGAARRLGMLEDRTRDLEREMAWDDPLVMAGAVASGQALAGRVLSTDPERKIRDANGRLKRRPLVTIKPSVEYEGPAGTSLFLVTAPSVELVVLPSEQDALVRLEVVSGANQRPTIDRLPKPDEHVILGPYGKPQRFSRPPVRDVPWTHLHPTNHEPAGAR